MSDPQRILLVRPSALGDVCRTVPVLAALRARYPSARIDWLVQEEFAPAIAGHPALTSAIAFPRSRLTPTDFLSGGALARLRSLLRQLRATRYDLAIDCQGLLRSGLLVRATNAPMRMGYADAAEHASRLYTHRVRAPRTLHTVDRMLALAEAATASHIASPDMRLYANDEALPEQLAGVRYAVIAPTSRWPAKRWPDQRFAEVARALAQHHAIDRVVLVGGPHEQQQIPTLCALARNNDLIINLVGATPMASLLAIIKHAALVLANDSAALHMAVGFTRPLVALFGPTRTALVGPYQHERDVLQFTKSPERNLHKHPGAGHAMMHAIPTRAVLDACAARLDAPQQPQAHPQPQPQPRTEQSAPSST